MQKCMECGNLFEPDQSGYSHFCCDDCSDRGTTRLCPDGYVLHGQIACSSWMRDNFTLCHHCEKRLERLITDECSRLYNRSTNE